MKNRRLDSTEIEVFGFGVCKRRFVISMLSSLIRHRPATSVTSKRSIEAVPNACRAAGILVNVSISNASHSTASRRNL